ncbi:hypothetical protein Q1695_010799 [Nippostrongylus brasiliensis]|nr:hypothetical protein Q1695_010799 [Nippostrongylus brasiliensis]
MTPKPSDIDNCLQNNRNSDGNDGHAEFISGVVEGFYGRPWTYEQRKHLFGRLNRLGLNTYVYAPKDDLKHRPQWRIPYNEEEAEILRGLIDSAKANNITFVYSLSPGIDIGYSKMEEIICIKSKLDQVRRLGCTSFALLFDDIECEMSEADRLCFNSFVSAQVAVANDVYEYLGHPQFFFCPTEYCESRAVPSLEHSEYLTTLGKDLHRDVHILWTGSRVISRYITVAHARSVAKVLRRKPLIWDNLHANDYDQKRVFMGDFSGRPVALKTEIAGLLMNPSCKYELNFVPLHTFADWNASEEDAPFVEPPNAVKQAADHANSSLPRAYHPLRSLEKAIKLWAEEFYCSGNHSEPPPLQEPSIPLEEILKAVVIPSPVDEEPTVNSLTADYGEPMETSVTSARKEEPGADGNVTTVELSDVVMTDVDSVESADVDQIAMLVDMFYLPFECGRKACKLLEQFSWLYANAPLIDRTTLSTENANDVEREWIQRFTELQSGIETVNSVFRYIVECQNKALVSELIPYIWDAQGSCSVLLGVARWMKEGFATTRRGGLPRTWNLDREDEPWMIGGGFLCECSRLVAPSGPIVHLFNNRTLLPLSVVNYEIRPYNRSDLESLVALSISSLDYPNASFTLQKEVFLDKFIMPFLETTPQHCFLARELTSSSENKIISAVSAHPDARSFFEHRNALVSSLKEKYEARDNDDKINTDDIDKWYPAVPDEIFNQYPAWLDARLLVDAYDSVPTKRLIQVAAATLFINGCSGIFVTVPVGYEDHVGFFSRLGFSELGKSTDGKFAMLGHLLMINE